MWRSDGQTYCAVYECGLSTLSPNGDNEQSEVSTEEDDE